MENGNPLVSVIMSTYNESECELSASIDSILSQSYKNIEFLIVNDNPKNETLRSVLNKYLLQDDRIIILENLENIGLVNSLNKAILHSRANYLARMDADDIAKPERIQQQMAFMNANNLDLVGGFFNLIDENGTSLNQTVTVPVKHHQICKDIRWRSCIPHPTWLVRREVYETLGGYRQIPYAEDYDFILRLLKTNYKVGNVPCVVLDYRVRPSGISVSNSLKQDAVQNYLAENRRNIQSITEEMVAEIIVDSQNPFYLYIDKKNAMKNALKRKHLSNICIYGFSLILDKYFWLWFAKKLRYVICR